MQINKEGIDDTREEIEIIESLIELDGKFLLELGCGKAQLSRALVSRGKDRRLVATEVDPIQHAKNLDAAAQENIRFENWGAQKIASEDNTFDVVFMFKSLHHVPKEMIEQAFCEIHRVLKRGGVLYISEPIFDGDFNDILKIFHDEEAVRLNAFTEICNAIKEGLFSLEAEVFFRLERSYADFSVFEEQIIGATHTEHQLSGELLAETKRYFAEKTKKNGGVFWSPIRIDLLIKS